MKEKTTQSEINKMVELRKTGHSLPEIRKITHRGNATIHRYIKDVKILPEYRKILNQKQGGSKVRSFLKWQSAEIEARNMLDTVHDRDLLFILACLYWAEGNKKDLNLINSDPDLVRIFVRCLVNVGVKKEDLLITLRVYSDLDKNKAKKYWGKILGIPSNQILSVNVLEGKKVGKLEYGMCRVRVRKSEYYFKLIMSMIKYIKNSI